MERFNDFNKTTILCESIPIKSKDKESSQGQQIKEWWENVEQASLKMGIKYQFVYDADISDCYGSIYTHSISWAIHGIEKSKRKRNPNQLTGNKIDWFIKSMRYGQTNGIPQGSVLMDFIAEIILGYTDELLFESIKKHKIKQKDYKIIRFRDDYKIFTNNQEIGLEILKILSETLSGLGLKLNTSKTKINQDPILASVKEDKIDELFIPQKQKNLTKWMLQIYATTSKHPNSGKTVRQLKVFIIKYMIYKIKKEIVSS